MSLKVVISKSCKEISLVENEIDDEGMRQLAGAVGSGTMPHIESVYLWFNPGVYVVGDVVDRAVETVVKAKRETK